MPETAAEQKESRSPEAPADIVILFILMNLAISLLLLQINLLLPVEKYLLKN